MMQSEYEEILPSCLVGGPEIAFLEHKGRKRGCAYLPSAARNFLRIPYDDCLRYCKMSCDGLLPAISLYWVAMHPFISSVMG